MRWLCFILIGGMVCSGCATRKTAHSESASATSSAKGTTTTTQVTKAKPTPAKPANSSLSVTNGNTVITLTDVVLGKVVSVNAASRFVILDYSLNRLPAVGDRLNVYRQDAKVGEIKVSGPQRNNLITADIMAGEAQPGDDVRPN